MCDRLWIYLLGRSSTSVSVLGVDLWPFVKPSEASRVTQVCTDAPVTEPLPNLALVLLVWGTCLLMEEMWGFWKQAVWVALRALLPHLCGCACHRVRVHLCGDCGAGMSVGTSSLSLDPAGRRWACARMTLSHPCHTQLGRGKRGGPSLFLLDCNLCLHKASLSPLPPNYF